MCFNLSYCILAAIIVHWLLKMRDRSGPVLTNERNFDQQWQRILLIMDPNATQTYGVFAYHLDNFPGPYDGL